MHYWTLRLILQRETGERSEIRRSTEMLRLSTLDRSAHVEIPSLSLNITDMSGENVIHLVILYVTHELPITSENGAVPEDLSRWPHCLPEYAFTLSV